jgi:hypothetical protein
VNSACVLDLDPKLISTPDKSSPDFSHILTIMLYGYIITAVAVELLFAYKTNLLPVL